MDTTLAIVSYPRFLDAFFEEVCERLLRGAPAGFVLERCQEPDEVPDLARRWKRRGRRLLRVDLLGHGAGGLLHLGDGPLFAADGTGYGLARRLRGALAPDAELRLLGCRTGERHWARDLDGAAMLRDSKKLLGVRRRVLGTRSELSVDHFTAGGLNGAGTRLLFRPD